MSETFIATLRAIWISMNKIIFRNFELHSPKILEEVKRQLSDLQLRKCNQKKGHEHDLEKKIKIQRCNTDYTNQHYFYIMQVDGA